MSEEKKEFNIFDVKSVDEFVERVTKGFNMSFEKEIKEYIKRLKVEYLRDDQNAVNTGITAKVEESAKEWICPRIPKWVTPDMLTVLGVFSVLIIGVGYILGFFEREYLFLVIIGLVLHWFGDSFDGSLARYRKKTRPNYGYYIDHIVDSIAVLIFSLGLGLSGFVKIEISLLFAIMYLILIVHVDLITYVQNEFKYSFGLIGPTEMRIIGGVFTIVMYFAPVRYFNIFNHLLTQYDIGVFCLSLGMFVVIVFNIFKKGIELDRIDRSNWVR